MQRNGGIKMNNKFYNIKDVSFCDRESFNNAILLLTMIKSEYYYIVGFSRVKGIINIAFDFESEYHKTITEGISLDFNNSDEEIIIKCEIQHFSGESILIDSNKYDGTFSVVNNKVYYLNTISKDDVFPLSIKDLNNNILICKNEIIKFLKENTNKVLEVNYEQ